MTRRDGREHVDTLVIDGGQTGLAVGYHFPGFSWIDLPVFVDGHLQHDRGVVASQPGLYFVGLHFLHALWSGQIQCMGRDAKHTVEMIAKRPKEQTGPAGMTAATRA